MKDKYNLWTLECDISPVWEYSITAIINNIYLMSIRIKPVMVKDPRNPEAPPKYYAAAKSRGIVNLDELSVYIADNSTVSRADVYAVLISLTDVLPYVLEAGNIVRLGALGSLMIKLSSSPSPTAEEVKTSNVKQIKLRFRPARALQQKVSQFSLSKT